MSGDDETDQSAAGDDDRTRVLEPTTDELTLELIRDAIGVARGELSDETFSEKYDVESTARPAGRKSEPSE
ncbi:MAG: 4Fe-4S ferredoxin N-terminal domain-containing protein [Halorubrum sp.]